MENIILEILLSPKKIDEIYCELNSISKKELQKILDDMVNQGKIMRNKKGKYGAPAFFGCVLGKFSATQRRFAFVLRDDDEDIFIPPKRENRAWDGDTVLVKLSPYSKGNRQEGEVIRVIKRSEENIIGTLRKTRNIFYMEPDSKKFQPIEIKKSKLKDARLGDKIAVKPVFYGDGRYMPSGVIHKVFGKASDREAIVKAILYENKIIDEFSKEAMQQAKNTFVNPEDFTNRRDLRDMEIFTIDGKYSKDFDDAISLEKEGDNYILGVHIADVSHYVRGNSPLDIEAMERGTSVYYANKVIPMLPFELSNEICSLKPMEDRLTFSAFITIDKNAKILSYEFAKTVICSKYRLTYDEVNILLVENKTNYPKSLVNKLREMDNLAKKLRARRFKRGALELDIKEYYVVCDDRGAPINVAARKRGDSEELIEEFMLCANEAAAEFTARAQFPCVYRVHEEPKEDKLENFVKFATRYGYNIAKGHEDDTRALQKVLDEAKGSRESMVLSNMLLRSLAKARYSEECLGHYGLMSEYYLHFTSPIRRYPDLAAHRMMEKMLTVGTYTKEDEAFCKRSAKKSSEREVLADISAREVEKRYVAEYMSQFIGDEFEGIISSVLSFGFFVEVIGSVEGLVRVESLEGDYFDFDEDNLAFIGKRTGKKYEIGQSVNVQLVASSITTGEIDFIIE